MNKKYITVFTGAGISADSGLSTFRDSDGLWNDYDIEDVASPKGFKNNPQLVWDFYRYRKYDAINAVPNAAHIALVKFEEQVNKLGYEFLIVTQNIDRLHHVAGSKNIVELHGNIHNLKCSNSKCDFITEEQDMWLSEKVPTCPKCGSYIRVDVVWFGENLDKKVLDIAFNAADNSHAMIICGTSGLVYPAASMVPNALANNAIIYESNIEPAFDIVARYSSNYKPFIGKASLSLPAAVSTLYNTLLSQSHQKLYETK